MRALAALLAKGIRRRNCPGASEIYTASIWIILTSGS
jgi:hypothetical protein